MSDDLNKGLEGVLVTESGLSVIDGDAGELVYRGYTIEDLANGASYEEVLYLLWHGRLPDGDELDAFAAEMAAEREVDEAVLATVREMAEAEENPMAALRTAVSMLSGFDPTPEDTDPTDEGVTIARGRRITAKVPTIIAAFTRIRNGDDPVAWVKNALAEGRRVSGFGHRVYNVKDPRAKILGERSKELGEAAGSLKWYEMSTTIEDYLMEERGLAPNVDFYSASTYYQMGIPLDIYTPIFAMSRVGGWVAHIVEYINDNRLIRPRARYVGPDPVETTFVSLDER